MEELQKWFSNRWEDGGSRHNDFDTDLASILTEAFDRGREDGYDKGFDAADGRPVKIK